MKSAAGKHTRFRCNATTCIVIAMLLFAACNQALAQTPEQTLSMLKEQAETVHTISSTFVQTTRIPLFQDAVQSQGRFLFKRPNALLWEITAPAKEGFALVGDTGMRWEQGKGRKPFSVQSDPVMTIVARQLMVWLTLNLAAIEKEYTITVATSTPPTLRLEPKSADMRRVIHSLTILFSPQGVASQVTLEEANGGSTTILFTNTQVNITLPDSAFL